MKTKARLRWFLFPLLIFHASAAAVPATPSLTHTVRIAAAQAARRVIDFRVPPELALAAVDRNLVELEWVVHRARKAKFDALILPKDTAGLLSWVGMNETLAKQLLPSAVERIIQCLGARIISSQGRILATAAGPDDLAIAEIEVRGQRGGGDAQNWQRDMRARLFRERNPAAFHILTDAQPPVLAKVPIELTSQEAGRSMAGALTVGEEEFTPANSLRGTGRSSEAIGASEQLRKTSAGTGIDHRSEVQLAALRPVDGKLGVSASGLASKYPGDVGIAKDPEVLFADDFESGGMKKWDQQRGRVLMIESQPNAGRWCVEMPMERGKNQGGDAIKWFMPGGDTVYARFYVKFSSNYQYNHHFVWLGANQRTNKWSAFGKAGLKPNGTYYSTGMEPWFAWGQNPPPGEVNLYSYYLDMEPDRKMDKYWGNGFFPPGPGKGAAAGAARVIPVLNQWQCWEFMIQANSAPDRADGKQAMWIDGKLIGEFTGLRWRNDLDLKVNCFWLEHYGYDEGDPTKQYWKDSQSVWFDDVVVARRYIGPMQR